MQRFLTGSCYQLLATGWLLAVLQSTAVYAAPANSASPYQQPAQTAPRTLLPNRITACRHIHRMAGMITGVTVSRPTHSPTILSPDYAQPGYAQPRYTQPGYQPAYPQPAYPPMYGRPAPVTPPGTAGMTRQPTGQAPVVSGAQPAAPAAAAEPSGLVEKARAKAEAIYKFDDTATGSTTAPVSAPPAVTEPAMPAPAAAVESAEPPGLIEKARAKVKGMFKSDDTAASSTTAPVSAPPAVTKPAMPAPAAAAESAEPPGLIEKARAKAEAMFKFDDTPAASSNGARECAACRGRTRRTGARRCCRIG